MNIDIARAWKDAQYRGTLTSEELAQLPENPVGALELTDSDLASVSGAYSIGVPGAAGCCGAGLGLNINLTGCCATGGAASTAPSSNGGATGTTGYQGGSWHLSYVYDAGASMGACDSCSTGYYTSCNIC